MLILQCFDAAGWATGRASNFVKGLSQQFPRVYFWVCSKSRKKWVGYTKTDRSCPIFTQLLQVSPETPKLNCLLSLPEQDFYGLDALPVTKPMASVHSELVHHSSTSRQQLSHLTHECLEWEYTDNQALGSFVANVSFRERGSRTKTYGVGKWYHWIGRCWVPIGCV